MSKVENMNAELIKLLKSKRDSLLEKIKAVENVLDIFGSDSAPLVPGDAYCSGCGERFPVCYCDTHFGEEVDIESEIKDIPKFPENGEVSWTDESVAEFARISTAGASGDYRGCRSLESKLERYKELKGNDIAITHLGFDWKNGAGDEPKGMPSRKRAVGYTKENVGAMDELREMFRSGGILTTAAATKKLSTMLSKNGSKFSMPAKGVASLLRYLFLHGEVVRHEDPEAGRLTYIYKAGRKLK